MEKRRGLSSAVVDEQKSEYISRINRVLDYIDNNMEKKLTLEKLGAVANFSPYHFHRIFAAMVGETLNKFILRVRIERAATKLFSNPRKSITEIAFDCGFSSSSVFSRAFKEYYGVSASECRNGRNEYKSKICKMESNSSQTLRKKWKESDVKVSYNGAVDGNQLWRITMKNEMNVNVEIQDLKPMTVAYVRHMGPYKGDSGLFAELFGKLYRWAGPRGLLNFPETLVMSIYHDDPNLTEQDKLRLSVCITVPEETEVEGEIGKMEIPAGKWALARFELGEKDYEAAWQAVMGEWLPSSGYQPDDRPCMEIYRNNPEEHPEHKCVVDICIPVVPM